MLLPKGKDFRVLFDKPPHIVWGVAIAVAILEASVYLFPHLMRGGGVEANEHGLKGCRSFGHWCWFVRRLTLLMVI